ncbi:MAG TPA: hypothetical protein VD884_06625 [Ohtaekwangia sp.]|nr:hypothetical protein [Ohtaekwangia sp.]
MLRIKSSLTGALFVLLFIGTASAQKPKLVKTKVNQELTVVVPKGWTAMDAMDFTQRYPSVRAPLAAYTNEERTIDFSINVSATQWPDANLEISQQFFKASLMNMFDRVEMIGEGVREVNKKKFVFFEFTSRVNGIKRQEGNQSPVLKYTYIQYLVEPSRTLVFSFNCPQREMEDWQETAREMMDRIRIK